MSERHILAVGGALLESSGAARLERYALDLTGKAKPRVAFVPTASGDDVTYVARFFETYARLGVAAEALRFFRRTPDDLDAHLAGFDLVHVGGGNTRSMLAVWRHWGFDRALRAAWERGTVLFGSSAGSICWFASGVTDSVADELTTMSCLGFLPGSNCPHYDGERERRPYYRRAVGAGTIEAGIACDDGAGVHFVGTDLARAVAALPEANAYRVAASDDGDATETALAIDRLK